MRQAILSDLHSNLEATQGATHFACLGDCIGYGADPVPTLDLPDTLPHLLLIRGNHDQALFRDEGIDVPGIREALAWTGRQPTPAHASARDPQAREYLRPPVRVRACLAATPAHVTFIGHVHAPMVHYLTAGDSLREHNPEPGVPIPRSSTCRDVVNVGSVGQPRDGNPAAAYALCDSDRAEATRHREPSDDLRAAAKILAAGLSTRFAGRLKGGR